MADSRGERLEGYLGRLYGYAFSLCRDPDEAKDLVQECALRALAAREMPQDSAAYRAWLFKTLRNAYFDRLRRSAVREAAPAPEWEGGGPALEEYWRAEERLISVLAVKLELQRLPERHREIIGLVDVAGLTYAEAAETLEIPVGTVMSRISRARAALMEALASGNLRMLHGRRMS